MPLKERHHHLDPLSAFGSCENIWTSSIYRQGPCDVFVSSVKCAVRLYCHTSKGQGWTWMLDCLFVCLFVQALLVTSPGTKLTLVLKLVRRFGTNAPRSLKRLTLSQDANIHFHTQFSFKKKERERACVRRQISVWLKTNWRGVRVKLFEFHFMRCLSVVLARRLNGETLFLTLETEVTQDNSKYSRISRSNQDVKLSWNDLCVWVQQEEVFRPFTHLQVLLKATLCNFCTLK